MALYIAWYPIATTWMRPWQAREPPMTAEGPGIEGAPSPRRFTARARLSGAHAVLPSVQTAASSVVPLPQRQPQ
eukprot:1965406-Prymnesium_polylepis.1